MINRSLWVAKREGTEGTRLKSPVSNANARRGGLYPAQTQRRRLTRRSSVASRTPVVHENQIFRKPGTQAGILRRQATRRSARRSAHRLLFAGFSYRLRDSGARERSSRGKKPQGGEPSLSVWQIKRAKLSRPTTLMAGRKPEAANATSRRVTEFIRLLKRGRLWQSRGSITGPPFTPALLLGVVLALL